MELNLAGDLNVKQNTNYEGKFTISRQRNNIAYPAGPSNLVGPSSGATNAASHPQFQ